ncbi:MAG: hypothetical protein ACRCXZ_05110, partial [Patescibacteria group bacterium]
IRGKLFIDFYIIPFFFLIAISSIYFFKYIIEKTSLLKKFIRLPLAISTLVVIAFYAVTMNYKTLNIDEVTPSQKALKWINQNVDSNKYIAMDYGILMDLKDGKDLKYYPNADNYWKIDYEKEIKKDKFNNNPLNIDYLYLTNQLRTDMSSGNVPFTQSAFYNAKRIVEFNSDNITSEIYKTIKDRNKVVSNTWLSIKSKQKEYNLDEKIKLMHMAIKLKDYESYKYYFDQIKSQIVNSDGFKNLANPEILNLLESWISSFRLWGQSDQLYSELLDFVVNNKIKSVTDIEQNISYNYIEDKSFDTNLGSISQLDFNYFRPLLFEQINNILQDNRLMKLKLDGY